MTWREQVAALREEARVWRQAALENETKSLWTGWAVIYLCNVAHHVMPDFCREQAKNRLELFRPTLSFFVWWAIGDNDGRIIAAGLLAAMADDEADEIEQDHADELPIGTVTTFAALPIPSYFRFLHTAPEAVGAFVKVDELRETWVGGNAWAEYGECFSAVFAEAPFDARVIVTNEHGHTPGGDQ